MSNYVWKFLKCSWSEGMMPSEACVYIPVYNSKKETWVYMAKTELTNIEGNRCLAAVNTIKGKENEKTTVISLTDLFDQRMRTFEVLNDYLV